MAASPVYQQVKSPGPFPAFVRGPTLCDFGPSKLQVGGWVVVTITAVGTVTRDVNGQLLHCLFRFPKAGDPRGRCARWNKDFSDGLHQGFAVETDSGAYYLSQEVSLDFTGGVAGDVYAVSILQASHVSVPDPEGETANIETPRPFEYQLTSVLPVGSGGVALPLLHTRVRCLAGNLAMDGVDLPPSSHWAPATAIGAFTSRASSIVQTGGFF